MYVLVWGIIGALKPSRSMTTATTLGSSCLMSRAGSQEPHVCPGNTKSLPELFLPRMPEVVWRVKSLGGETAAGMWQWGVRLLPACGRVVATAVLQGLEQNVTILCSVFCSVSFKDLLGWKSILRCFDLRLCLREVPPASAIVLLCLEKEAFEDKAAMSLYLVCWKSDPALWGTCSRLGQSKKRQHRPGEAIFSQADEMVWACESVKESMGCGFSPRSVAFIL